MANKKFRTLKYDYGLFLTTQWRMALMGRSLRKAKTTAVDDTKRKKPFWVKSFSSIFPEAGDNHIIERNLSALKALGLETREEKTKLSLIIPEKVKEDLIRLIY